MINYQNQKYCPSQYVDQYSSERNIIAGDWRDQLDDNLKSLTNGTYRTIDAYEI